MGVFPADHFDQFHYAKTVFLGLLRGLRACLCASTGCVRQLDRGLGVACRGAEGGASSSGRGCDHAPAQAGGVSTRPIAALVGCGSVTRAAGCEHQADPPRWWDAGASPGGGV